MEIIRGKNTSALAAPDLLERVSRYSCTCVDVGTGDGKYVLYEARRCPDSLVIGLDACRDGLRVASRKAPENALFVAANALDMPAELKSLADSVTINFPWGSLLAGLLTPEPALLSGLADLVRPDGTIEIRLNLSALADTGSDPEAASRRLRLNLEEYGFGTVTVSSLGRSALREFPSTWSRKLAHGRNPHAILVRARRTTPRPTLPPNLMTIIRSACRMAPTHPQSSVIAVKARTGLNVRNDRDINHANV